MKKKSSYRVEKDSMGEMKIPQEMLYGASTQRAVLNFPISGRRFSRPFIRALGQVKYAAAQANYKLKALSAKNARAISKAALDVSEGTYDEHFVVDIFQTGSGTSTNMNANEVIATLANRALRISNKTKGAIHPNDHVNKGQSSNDVIPTAMHVAVLMSAKEDLIPELKKLQKELAQKAKAFSKVYKIGRTHLQDATPITLGQEFGGYAEQVKKSIDRIESVYPRLRELAIGGTAVGTGINTHPRFASEVCKVLNKKFREKFKEAKDHFEAQGAKDACVEMSGQLKTLAVSLNKIANDIRWLGCGPRAGFSEIQLPAVQPGSSIMPGKINPVMAEALIQVAAEVIGNDTTVTICGQNGNFELNVMMPVMAHNLLESINLLKQGCLMFRTKCLSGIKANREACEAVIEKSLMLSTPLVPALGYDMAAKIAKEAYQKNKTIREVVQERRLLSEKDLARILDVKKMV